MPKYKCSFIFYISVIKSHLRSDGKINIVKEDSTLKLQQKLQQQKENLKKTKVKLNVPFSIRNRLIIAFLLVLLLPTITLGYFSNLKAEHEIDNLILDSTRQTVTIIDTQINSLISTTLEDLDYLSKNIKGEMVDGLESPELRKVLEPMKAVKKEYDHVQYATKDGQLLNSPQQTFADGFDVRERDWYNNALNEPGKTFVNAPIISQDGKVIVVPSKAAEDNSGVVSVVLSLQYLAEEVNKIKIGENGYVTIMDKNMQYLTHPELATGTEAEESFVTSFNHKTDDTFDYVTTDGERFKVVMLTNQLTGWNVVGFIDQDEIAAASEGIYVTTIIIILVTIVVGLVLVLAIIRSIHRPLKALITATEKIAEGDLRQNVTVNAQNELGLLSAAINRMATNLRQIIGQVHENTQQVVSTSEELTASAEQTRSTADHISNAVQEIATGAERQASSALEFSQSISEISTGMERASESIQYVTQLTITANEKATNGNKVVEQTIEQMNLLQQTVHETATVIGNLGDKANEIGHITSLITDIAGQTNLLALNAAIEASRAGEHGKGFAVVADEVRKLAEQSANAAGQISNIIQQLQVEAGKAVESIQNGTTVVLGGISYVHMTGETFKEIVTSIESVAEEAMQVSSIVQQVNSNSQNMVNNAKDVSNVAGQAASNTQNVAAATEEQSASMEEVSAAAEALGQMAQELQDVVNKFKL